jgi:pimeloyl-ACP methyl ester carboxylesterase
MDQTQTSGYLSVGRRRLYGTLFRPAVPRPLAVVLYDAFGEEKKSAFRVLVRLARACAGHGFATWRFDLSGTGESAGAHGDASWEDWQEEAVAAAAFARTQAGTDAWVAVGVRLGAFQAVHAAGRGGALAVVLVEPVLTGEECLRDLDRRQRIKQVVVGAGGADEDSAARWARGETVDFGGFEVSSRLAAELRPESLVSRLGSLSPDCPLHVVRVSGSKAFPPAWKPLTERAEARPPGRAEVVRDKPFWGQLEYYESAVVQDAVVGFLEALCGRLANPSGAGEARPG